uniref:CCAAT-binding factor domain-containing protein n=1 Tax=Meloidogyne javanica TaxID=6303 RepID=A0A915LQE9_MELJA
MRLGNKTIKNEEKIKEENSALEQKLGWFEQNGNSDDEEGEETYFDIKDETSSSTLNNIKYDKQNIPSLPKRRNAYDPNARNPLFSGADFSLDTELYILARHYHPTVASFARTLIQGGSIHYKGDPLIDLSQM